MIAVWFRNDIRLDDNPAFYHALQQAMEQQRPLIALFVATPQQWQAHDRSAIQVEFLKRHIQLLEQQLSRFHIPLRVSVSPTFSIQVEALSDICRELDITDLFVNHELEINEVERDKALASQLDKSDTQYWQFEADVIAPKGQVLTKQGEMFKVFTPFKREWLNQMQLSLPRLASSHQALQAYGKSGLKATLPGTHTQAYDWHYEPVDSTQAQLKHWPLVDGYRDRLNQFIASGITNYALARDIPSLDSTSSLSPYLAIGAISPKRVFHDVLQHCPSLLESQSDSHFPWLNQLIWRDFYRHLLFHYPELAKHKNFNPSYDHLPWGNDPELFRIWCQGKTGYPIIDAAMRQLQQTGWMHNRLRMLVASFLTKHLLIDWRLGERHFSRHLIDIDLANNNGGWQWAASTGCDALPYFRIFNPITQSQKFDPDGQFIRKYLPELKDVPNKAIHFPHEYLAAMANHSYWPAVVEHKQARAHALETFAQCRQE